MSLANQIKVVINNDEYYSPQNVVDLIVPYVQRKDGIETIWCPFDKRESLFVETFMRLGYKVNYGHIEDGQDFFSYNDPQGDIVISNPPYSKRQAILERLYSWDIPFALVLNFNGLFDNAKRFELFRDNDVQLLIPKGRMKFTRRDKEGLNSPIFQSIYVCHKLLLNQIVFDDSKKF